MKSITRLNMILLLALLPFVLKAQPPQAPFRERMEAARVAYITRSMQLSPQEARIFWPLHDAYIEKIKAQRQARIEGRRDPLNFDEMSDAEINKFLDRRLDLADAAMKARKEFINQLRKELSPRKAAMFIRAEDDFQRDVVDRLRPDDDRTMPPARRRR